MADHVHISNKRWDVKLYGPPNKAIGDILMGDRVAGIVGNYTKKVAATYSSMMQTRATPDNSRAGLRKKREGIPHLYETVTAGVNPNDGYKGDRWIGEVSAGGGRNPYAQPDEYGRNQYAPYEGRNQLEEALRMHLRHSP